MKNHDYVTPEERVPYSLVDRFWMWLEDLFSSFADY
jgi:hypothetical protein